MKLQSIILALALALSACATGNVSAPARTGASGTDCILGGRLSSWRPLDDENLVVFATRWRPYHVVLTRPAMGLEYDIMISFYDRDGRICPYGGDAIVIDGGFPERISIRGITRLTESELEALYADFGISRPAVVEGVELGEDGESADAP